MSILIVEDNATNAMILKHLARKVADDEIIVQADANEALVLCHQTLFNLLIVDQILPGMSGLQFVTTLRQLGRYDQVPIIMVTADNEPGLRQAARQVGITDFLTKPVEALAFRQLIANYRGGSVAGEARGAVVR
ncbi:response regulator [Agrobacterium vitis]|uniref:response regulator n=1 Tax=Rhizobium/Agrobacterium group TaxID=227290 RepID=UPI0008DC04CE|nr:MULTISPECIES: response regulator [Rhizobium/Agrobacterium group]MCF1435488.1 response regulator [Allorhizobium ampelinum]MUO88740.1 response regulator [Agrobacterium vitis]MUZ52097.1 response regulator [Agrobacterium vitis]MUZ91853.1 response regulator [Agrobacterium vitis]MVA39943.1 response regulator [Agrobacterium vitis]